MAGCLMVKRSSIAFKNRFLNYGVKSAMRKIWFAVFLFFPLQGFQSFTQGQPLPVPDGWNWSLADAWLSHIIENDQVLRIHGPISPQCSNWAMGDVRTADELSN